MPAPRTVSIVIEGVQYTADYNGREQRECLRLGQILPSDEAENVLRTIHMLKAELGASLDSDEEWYAPPTRKPTRRPRKRKEWTP